MRDRLAVAVLAAALAGSIACDSGSPTGASRVPEPAVTGAPGGAGSSGSPSLAVVQPLAQAPTTLVAVTAGTTGTSNNYVGQSVTIPGHGAYKDLRFNWYTVAGSPTAFGTLYLLDREYLGAPEDLGPSTPGFIAQSVDIDSGQYVFDPKVKVKGGATCWFYTDTQGAFVTGFASDTYAGGDMYVTGMPALDFHPEPTTPSGAFVDANFRLEAE